MSIQYRTPFSPDFNFVVKQPLTFNGHDYERGDDFDKANVEPRLLQLLWEQHKLDTVIPTIVLKKEASEAAPKAKPGKKPKAAEPAAAPEAAEGPKRYSIKNNFGKVMIMDGDTVVRECADFDAAKAAMAELAGE